MPAPGAQARRERSPQAQSCELDAPADPWPEGITSDTRLSIPKMAIHRARNTAQKVASLRHFTLNVVKRDAKRKVGFANARKWAGWHGNYLLEFLIAVDP